MNLNVAPEEQPPAVAPLRKRQKDGSLYCRRPEVEAVLPALVGLPALALVERARVADADDPDYLSSECIVHLLRREDLGEEPLRELFVTIRRRIMHAVPVFPRRAAGTSNLGERSSDKEIQEYVLQKFSEMLCNHRRGNYEDRLDFFESQFNLAVCRLRSTARKKVWRDESRYESTDFTENAESSPKETESALLVMRDALNDRGLDYLYRSKLHAAINALPPDLRRVVELTFHEVPDGPKGGDAITICNLIGRNEKTVYNRRKKAYEALRDALKEEEQE